MIHRVREGEKTHLGINYFINWNWLKPWAKDKDNTRIRLVLLVPLFAFYSTYEDFETGAIVKGWRAYVVGFRYRWRNPAKFDDAHLRNGIRSLISLSAKVVKTLEEMEDETDAAAAAGVLC